MANGETFSPERVRTQNTQSQFAQPQPQVQQAPPSAVFQTPNPVTPGVLQQDISGLNQLTSQQIAAAAQASQAQSQLGVQRLQNQAGMLNFQTEEQLRRLQRMRQEAIRAVINNSLSRGIGRSGITKEGVEDVERDTAEERSGLERQRQLGLQDIALAIAQQAFQGQLGGAQAATGISQEMMQLIGSLLQQHGLADQPAFNLFG